MTKYHVRVISRVNHMKTKHDIVTHFLASVIVREHLLLIVRYSSVPPQPTYRHNRHTATTDIPPQTEQTVMACRVWIVYVYRSKSLYEKCNDFR